MGTARAQEPCSFLELPCRRSATSLPHLSRFHRGRSRLLRRVGIFPNPAFQLPPIPRNLSKHMQFPPLPVPLARALPAVPRLFGHGHTTMCNGAVTVQLRPIKRGCPTRPLTREEGLPWPYQLVHQCFGPPWWCEQQEPDRLRLSQTRPTARVRGAGDINQDTGEPVPLAGRRSARHFVASRKIRVSAFCRPGFIPKIPPRGG